MITLANLTDTSVPRVQARERKRDGGCGCCGDGGCGSVVCGGGGSSSSSSGSSSSSSSKLRMRRT